MVHFSLITCDLPDQLFLKKALITMNYISYLKAKKLTLPLNAPWCRFVCVIPGGAANQHLKLRHVPLPGRILTGTSVKQLGRGRGQAVPCPPSSPQFLTRHTTKWIPSGLCSRDPGSSYQSSGWLHTNSQGYSWALQWGDGTPRNQQLCSISQTGQKTDQIRYCNFRL